MLTALAAGYVLLATPAISHALLAGLQAGFSPVEQRPDGRDVRVMAILGNGAVSYVAGDRAIHQLVRRTAYCVLEGARLHDLLEPAWVIVSGGVANPRAQTRPECEIMRDLLVEMGIPPARILLEPDSRTTERQIAGVTKLLGEKQLGNRVILVTTPAHMRRAVRLASSHGLDVVPAVASKLRYDNHVTGWRRWRPSMAALAGSESAMYEWMALAYTRLGRQRSATPGSSSS
jgi:uncharacterized SAM-binding protein YcdF (DUF218 family)